MPKKMKIGILIPHSGPAGLWGPSTDAAALLAASEINAASGVLGHEIEVTIADPGWNVQNAVGVVRDLIDLDRIDALVGMHPSNIRRMVKAQLAGKIPYIYTPQYEGGELNETTIATGGTDSELMRATLPWLAQKNKSRRFCILANDYIWPETALNTAKSIIGEARGNLVGEVLIPFGSNYEAEIELIRQLRPDVLVMFLLGEELVQFNRKFCEAKMPDTMIRYALGLDENVLYGIGAEGTVNLFGATTFSSDNASHKTRRFLELYHEHFGETAPTVSVFGQSCYEGLHLAAELARRAGSIQPEITTNYLRTHDRRGGMKGILDQRNFDKQNSIFLVEAKDLTLELVKQ